MLPNFLQIFDESSRVASVSVWRINALGWKVVQLLEVGVHHDLLLVGVLERLGPEKQLELDFKWYSGDLNSELVRYSGHGL